jgi:hypothetical protein
VEIFDERSSNRLDRIKSELRNVIGLSLRNTNQRLDIIAQEQIFTNVLNFVSIVQLTDEMSSIADSVLD